MAKLELTTKELTKFAKENDLVEAPTETMERETTFSNNGLAEGEYLMTSQVFGRKLTVNGVENTQVVARGFEVEGDEQEETLVPISPLMRGRIIEEGADLQEFDTFTDYNKSAEGERAESLGKTWDDVMESLNGKTIKVHKVIRPITNGGYASACAYFEILD